jgi:hypothetical protein
MRTRSQFSAEFKAKVALEAIKGPRDGRGAGKHQFGSDQHRLNEINGVAQQYALVLDPPYVAHTLQYRLIQCVL